MRPTIPARHAAHPIGRLRLFGRADDTACDGRSNARKCSKYQFCLRATHGDVTHVRMATTCTPAPVRARSVETTPIDSLTRRSGSRVFAVRVPDASLRPIALRPGDVVVCEHGIEPRHGNVMAALVDGTSVRRVWSLKKGRPWLRRPDGQAPPENAEDLAIQGVAVQVVRSRGR
jgi:hypothetical protein